MLRYSPYPFRFIQNSTHKTPTHMFILSEGMGSFRQIFMDGRQHPTQPDPDLVRPLDRVGQKDTLVIDTVGFNDKFWFDRTGTPHTEQLHTIERWTRIDRGHLMKEVTLDDPGAYSRPFTVTFQATLSPRATKSWNTSATRTINTGSRAAPTSRPLVEKAAASHRCAGG